MMIRKGVLLIVAVLLTNKSVFPAPQLITEKPLTESSIQDQLAPKVDALFMEYERGHSPGLAVVVVRDEKVLLRKGYGFASLEHRIRITPSTVFDLASLAKQFTGFAVATLVENGTIRLSDDIRKYVPEVPDFGAKITIDNLVHHTSGLRDWPSLMGMAGWNWDDVITFDHVLALTSRQKSLNFTPGAEFAYSNTGYNLLAEMVARVTGKPFRNWTDENIFKPLGMANTHFHSDHTEFVPNRSSSYRRNPDGLFHCVPDNLAAFGSSSLFGTIDDMAKWLINFDNTKVGGPAVLARMRTLTPLNDGNINRYAFGLINGHYRGLPIIEHTGGWAAYSSYVMHFPKQHFGILMVANTNAVNLPVAVTRVVDIFLDKELGPPVPWVTESVRPAVKVASDLLKKYVGLYSLSPDLFIRIKQSGSTLTMQKTHSGVLSMTPRSESEFMVDASGEPIAFLQEEKDRRIYLTYQGRRIPLLKDADISKDASRFAEYGGEYFSEELLTSYRVEANDGKLALWHLRHGKIALSQLHKDDFSSSIYSLNSIEFQRSADGKVKGFCVYTGDQRNRRIEFVKQR